MSWSLPKEQNMSEMITGSDADRYAIIACMTRDQIPQLRFWTDVVGIRDGQVVSRDRIQLGVGPDSGATTPFVHAILVPREDELIEMKITLLAPATRYSHLLAPAIGARADRVLFESMDVEVPWLDRYETFKTVSDASVDPHDADDFMVPTCTFNFALSRETIQEIASIGGVGSYDPSRCSGPLFAVILSLGTWATGAGLVIHPEAVVAPFPYESVAKVYRPVGDEDGSIANLGQDLIQ